ncbi:MAG: cytochrome c biogenesis protein CcsA, partial [Actinomycetota bacterium]|nr:cytochrome c biogenesis protein [Actinomycetota bacterium]
MADQGLAHLSDNFFWIALVVYAVAMVGYFASLAYRWRWTGSVATVIAALGAVSHATSIITRGLAAGRVPWGNMYEYSSLVGLLLVTWFLIFVQGRNGMRQIGGFAMALGVLLLAAARLLYAPAGPLVPALNTYWIKIHVVAAISASSIFSLSFIFTVLYLVKDRVERRGALFGGSTVGAA